MRFFLLLFFITSCASLTWTAIAPSECAAQAADVNAEARVFFERGNRSFAAAMRRRGRARQQGLEQALEAYVSSLRIVRSRNALFNAAAVLETLGRLDEAFAYYREYLDIEGLSDADRRAGEEKMAALRPRVAVVRVESTPAGATVRVDRLDLAPRGRTPLELALPEGEHTFYLALDHHEDARVTGRATVGRTTRLAPSLTPSPRPLRVELPSPGRILLDGEPVTEGGQISPGHHVLRYEPTEGAPQDAELDVPAGDGAFRYAFRNDTGTVRVLSVASARVSLDGEEVGRGADVQAQAPSGSHVLVVTAPGRRAARREIRVRAGQTLRLEIALAEQVTDTTNPAARWTGISAAVAAAVFGTVAYQARRQRDDYDAFVRDRCPAGCDMASLEEGRRRADKVDRYNHAADAVLAVTGALALTSVLLVATGVGEEHDTSVAVAPLDHGAMAIARFSLEGL